MLDTIACAGRSSYLAQSIDPSSSPKSTWTLCLECPSQNHANVASSKPNSFDCLRLSAAASELLEEAAQLEDCSHFDF